jgi:FKBP-type peptidyl-prolyl cis-trans isomerase FkpA
MKKSFLFVLFCIAIISYFACSKSVTPQQPACTNVDPNDDSAALVKYAAADSVIPTRDSTGLYYHIIDSGSSAKPTLASNLMVTYTARFIPSNVLFDSANNSNLNGAQLGTLIYGWQFGLPKIGVGGHIQLFIPSALGWGCTGYGTIPPNAPVFFDIKLISVY